jgi:hypothetical protein
MDVINKSPLLQRGHFACNIALNNGVFGIYKYKKSRLFGQDKVSLI